jgi:hypothetical protein
MLELVATTAWARLPGLPGRLLASWHSVHDPVDGMRTDVSLCDYTGPGVRVFCLEPCCFTQERITRCPKAGMLNSRCQ